MKSVSITYHLKWQFKLQPNYKWTSCGKLINTRTGRIIRKVLNGSVGYWIGKDFYSLTKLKSENLIEKIKQSKWPF